MYEREVVNLRTLAVCYADTVTSAKTHTASINNTPPLDTSPSLLQQLLYTYR